MNQKNFKSEKLLNQKNFWIRKTLDQKNSLIRISHKMRRFSSKKCRFWGENLTIFGESEISNFETDTKRGWFPRYCSMRIWSTPRILRYMLKSRNWKIYSVEMPAKYLHRQIYLQIFKQDSRENASSSHSSEKGSTDSSAFSWIDFLVLEERSYPCFSQNSSVS